MNNNSGHTCKNKYTIWYSSSCLRHSFLFWCYYLNLRCLASYNNFWQVALKYHP